MELERSESQRRQRRRPPRSKRRTSRTMNSSSDEEETDEQFIQKADVKMEAEAETDVKMEAEAEKMVAAFMSDSEEEAMMDEQSIRAILQTQGRHRKPPRLMRRSSRDSRPWPRLMWCKRWKHSPEETQIAFDYIEKIQKEIMEEAKGDILGYIRSRKTASTAI